MVILSIFIDQIVWNSKQKIRTQYRWRTTIVESGAFQAILALYFRRRLKLCPQFFPVFHPIWIKFAKEISIRFCWVNINFLRVSTMKVVGHFSLGGKWISTHNCHIYYPILVKFRIWELDVILLVVWEFPENLFRDALFFYGLSEITCSYV